MTNDGNLNIDANQLSKTNEYYINATQTLVGKAFKVMLCFGLIVLITWWDMWDIVFIIIMGIFSFYAGIDIYHTIRNLNRPFIILGGSHIVVGTPSISIPYTWVESFAFDRSRKSDLGVAFSLFPRAGAPLPQKIEGGGPVSLKDGRIVCQNTHPGRGASVADFFNDFGARLEAAGATDASSDQNNVVKMNAVTGEAVVMKKGGFTSAMTTIGGIETQTDANWFSFRAGAFIVIFIGMAVFLSMKELNYIFGKPLRDIVASIGASLFIALLVGTVSMSILSFFIEICGRNEKIASCIADVGEVKKLFLGATVGAGLAFLGGWALFTVIDLLRSLI